MATNAVWSAVACLVAAIGWTAMCVAARRRSEEQQTQQQQQQQRNCSLSVKGPVFDRQADFLLMFNYGKVASETLRLSLADSVLNGSLPIYLNKGGLGKSSLSEAALRQEQTRLPQFAKTHESRMAELFLSRVPAGRRVWILTACRNPFEFLVSRFWEHFKAKRFEWMKDAKNVSSIGVDTILDRFSEETAKWTSVGQWFGHGSFLAGVGLDLAACGGKFSEGSLYIDRMAGGVRQSIVLTRMEEIKLWPAILGKYMPGFRLSSSIGTRDMKWFHLLADQFDARWTWPEEDMRKVMSWDTWEFYSMREKMAMEQQQIAKERWKNTKKTKKR